MLQAVSKQGNYLNRIFLNSNTYNYKGQLEKQSRDLEKKVDQEQSRVSQHNFERIRQDLEQVLKENSQLINQIKAYK